MYPNDNAMRIILSSHATRYHQVQRLHKLCTIIMIINCVIDDSHLSCDVAYLQTSGVLLIYRSVATFRPILCMECDCCGPMEYRSLTYSCICLSALPSRSVASVIVLLCIGERLSCLGLL